MLTAFLMRNILNPTSRLPGHRSAEARGTRGTSNESGGRSMMAGSDQERMADRDVALRLHGLSKTFPGQRALEDVDLVVAAGEIHALVGQNGSGKSTIVKILAGYHQPDAGAVAEVANVPFELGS